MHHDLPLTVFHCIQFLSRASSFLLVSKSGIHPGLASFDFVTQVLHQQYFFVYQPFILLHYSYKQFVFFQRVPKACVVFVVVLFLLFFECFASWLSQFLKYFNSCVSFIPVPKETHRIPSKPRTSPSSEVPQTKPGKYIVFIVLYHLHICVLQILLVGGLCVIIFASLIEVAVILSWIILCDVLSFKEWPCLTGCKRGWYDHCAGSDCNVLIVLGKSCFCSLLHWCSSGTNYI